jgi:hypothetical protein
MITIFCDFRQFSANKLAFSSKTNVMIEFIALFWVKKGHFYHFFGKNIFKIITSIPRQIFRFRGTRKPYNSRLISYNWPSFHKFLSPDSALNSFIKLVPDLAGVGRGRPHLLLHQVVARLSMCLPRPGIDSMKLRIGQNYLSHNYDRISKENCRQFTNKIIEFDGTKQSKNPRSQDWS